jgi:carboxypeptidase Taq
LKAYSTEYYHLMAVSAILQWDQEVYMPPGGVQDRAAQLALVTGIIHAKGTSQELGELLQKAESEHFDKLSVEDKALVRVMRRSFDQNTKLPGEFVQEFSRLTSESVHAWIEARKKNSFKDFAPYLEKVVAMSRKQAEYLGYADHPYDALLDLYEEGLTTADVKRIFTELKEPLVKLLPQATQRWNKKLEVEPGISASEQAEFCKKVAEYIGYDFKRGRMDTAPHPFMTALGHGDRRITTRYNEHTFESIFGVMHECGHAMYEQGISDRLAYTSLDTGVSLGMHESQSRMWENMIGRSKEFWEGYFPTLQQEFPAQFEKMSVEDFYRQINHVHPSLIRTEADEVSYNLHILIRFEMEIGLMDGSVNVSDVPELWNAKYKEYLGVDVPSDANGCLQDIHWSHGTLGYFPTYTLGNLASAQIWNAYKKYDPEYKNTLTSGNLKKIREWLTENMYQYGSVYQPKELLKRITGEEYDSRYLVEYLREKFLN